MLDIFHTILVGASNWSYLVGSFGDPNIHDKIFWYVLFQPQSHTRTTKPLALRCRSLGVTVAVTVSPLRGVVGKDLSIKLPRLSLRSASIGKRVAGTIDQFHLPVIC